MSVHQCSICLVNILLPKEKKIADYNRTTFEFEGAFALSETLEPVATKCGHLFHQNCLRRWLETYKSGVSAALCPNCRHEIIPKAMVQKYAQHHADTFSDESDLAILIMMTAWVAYCNL